MQKSTAQIHEDVYRLLLAPIRVKKGSRIVYNPETDFIESGQVYRAAADEDMSDFSMGLYFSDKKYLARALEFAVIPPESTHTFNEAMLLALSAARPQQLDNLCKTMQQELPALSIDECYQLTRGQGIPGKIAFSDVICDLIWNCAIRTLEQGLPLGTEISESHKHNTSALWGHLFMESNVAGQLCAAAGLDADTGKKLGILHDFGRTQAGTLLHGMKGFELLSDMGWDREAMGALTHSFLNGGRCTNLEEHIPGFSVDHEGRPCFDESTEIDDITLFLNKYKYTTYDDILNVADLMATRQAIVQPAERVADILTRRVFDPVNYWYFLAELTNKLWELRELISSGNEKAPVNKCIANATTQTEEIQKRFEGASRAFYETYLSVCTD